MEAFNEGFTPVQVNIWTKFCSDAWMFRGFTSNYVLKS